jgi:hypothetical protein
VNLRLVVTILVIAAAPVCAQAQKPTPATVTKADGRLTASGARHFVVGSLFSYICFDGTHGSAASVQSMAPSNFKAQG